MEHLLLWLKIAYDNVLNHHSNPGQAIFICGPKNNGKTLLCEEIVAPLLGNRTGNPMDFILGETTFNSDLFETALLAANDEAPPADERLRRRMASRLKRPRLSMP